MKIIDTITNNVNKIDLTEKNEIPPHIIVFSHLRWDFVYQRPQHILTRLAVNHSICFIEEPIADATEREHYSTSKRGDNIVVMVPHVLPGTQHDDMKAVLKRMFDGYMENKKLSNYAFWYYTPLALEFSRKYTSALVVYDCMDELSAFKFAPPALKALERELLQLADVVFTGGRSLYEAKKNQHNNIHSFPSSIETGHFLKTRHVKKTASGRPRNRIINLGFFGVIDERFDIDLIRGIADARPDWQLILIGPVVKIDWAMLPQNPNIHYLGPKDYKDLPIYMAEWDIALIPFLLNESTRFISPTKTPEYLAAGLPVISTPIKDVINPYGKNQLVHIGSNAGDFVRAAEKELSLTESAKETWLNRVDIFLAQNSWDKTCSGMLDVMKASAESKGYASVAQ